MKRAIILLVTSIFLLTGANVFAKDWKKIRIGVEGAYPPFSSVTPDGKLEGFDIDIANALCAEMKAKCTLVQSDWDGIIPSLLVRKYDAIIASMSITEERKKKVAFSNKYYNTPAKFASKKGSNIEITAQGLKGKSVGVQRATIFDKFISAEFGDDVDIKRYASQDEAYLDASNGRLDLLMADSVAMSQGFLQKDAGKDWELIGPDYTDKKYFGEGAAVAIRKKDKDLVAKFNAAIDAIRANGTYDKIAKKYFGFNVYGE